MAEPKRAPSLQEAKREWTESFNGLAVDRTMTLQHPAIRRLFDRNYQNTARNAFFIAIYAPAILKRDEDIAQANEHIRANFKNVTDKIDARLIQARKVMDGTNTTDETLFAHNRHAEAFTVRVPSQTTMLQIKLFEKADQLLVAMQTLWINGDIDDSHRSKVELETKRLLRGSGSAVRQMFLALLKRANIANQKAAASEAASAGVPTLEAGAGTNDEAEESTQAAPLAAAA